MRLHLAIPCLALLACGPQAADPPGDESTTAADPTTGAPTTGEPPLTLTPDEQLCLDHCKHRQDEACPWFDAACFGDCLGWLEWADMGKCGAQRRASMACETMQPLSDTCVATACADVYLQEDLCTGTCSQFDTYPGQGADSESCEWRVDRCYDHDLIMRCTTGDAPTCTCTIDGLLAGECDLDTKLGTFSCGGDGFHIFSGCCTDLFVEAIQ